MREVIARLCAALALVLATPAGAQQPETVVQPALDGIFEAFESHPLVGLGDEHGMAAGMAFYEALVRDPRFASEVGNLVVEFGASGRQAIANRYLAGETVPYAELRTIWSDTVGWNPPPGWLGFARLLAGVRDVNKALPPERRIEVWLGEPPIDWSSATDGDVIGAMNARDSHPAAIIEREVLARGRKALVIYGGFHFSGGRWLRGQVEARHPDAFHVVLPYGLTHRPPACTPLLEIAAQLWPVAAMAGPATGTAPDQRMRDCATLSGAAAGVQSTGPAPAAQADAVVFYGPPASLGFGAFLPDYLFDAGYRREMARRAGPRLVRFPTGWTFRKADYAVDLGAPGYREAVDAAFATYDKNGDGTITRDEYVDPIP